jgi:glucose/arabinose dehydrogenase
MRRILRSLLGTGLLLLLGAPRGAQTIPDGFVLEPIGSAWNSPVGLCYLDAERLLVAERDGRVWFVEHDQKKNLVYDIADETLINGDRGLLGIAAHPDFDAQGGWLYLLLVVDTRGGNSAPLAFSRLIRVWTETNAQGELVADPATRQYLLGDTWSTGITSCHLSHTIGSLHFFADGSLVLTTGDNAHYDATDNGGIDPNCFLPGRTPADQDVGAYRAQYDNTLCGKVLRLDPETGRGLADNPFYTGDPDALLSRVYARGLRNPFRTTLVPVPGPREALVISDVGWNTWEEINLALGGENFGWPCYEGHGQQGDYQAADVHALCSSANAQHTSPLLAWNHSENQAGFRGNCATGICLYSGDRYPEIYRGRLFFCDYGRSWMRAAELDDTLHIQGSIGFGRDMNGPVELVAQPGTGDLVYVSISNGVFRLRYTGAGIPPTAVATASPAFGPGDLDVLLSAAGSSDPENQALSYAWDLGDNATYTEREFHHAFTGDVNYVARVTVTDSEGLASTADVRITPHNIPPTIDAVLGPLEGDTFVPDEPLRLLAEASDVEDVTPKATWTLDLVHDHHVHPDWATSTGLNTQVTPESHGPGDNHFLVHLSVADTRGSTDERTMEIYDRTSLPRAHLVDLSDSRVRVGQELAPVGHVDWAYGLVAPKKARLVWDWGDGTSDVYADAAHHVDTHPTHVYRNPGHYKLRLIADLLGLQHVTAADIEVLQPRPSVAIFAALDAERWVPRAQQEEIVAAITSALAGRASEVRSFAVGEGENLAAWMESLRTDPIADVLVLLDFVPEPLVHAGIPDSLLERWVEGGNGLVWSGLTPFLTILRDDGTAALTALGAEAFFGTTGTGIVQGTGMQTKTAIGTSVVPSFTTYRSERALRYDALGPAWSVARIFAEDGDHDSDALELARGARGFYAQFQCDPDDAALPRAAVLSEYLRDKIGKSKVSMPGSTPTRR